MRKKYPPCETCRNKVDCQCFKKGEMGVFCDKCGRRLCRKKENGDCIIEGRYLVPGEGNVCVVCY